ncbi:rCG32166 [Rattus norvegicus]|uniref:RCG32166 n=1 Tax=Rattus norvegicus TaxID=10116 RepID=A6JWS7_RAT|nr:rCG32166 [Rattus norvegicus]
MGDMYGLPCLASVERMHLAPTLSEKKGRGRIVGGGDQEGGSERDVKRISKNKF